MQKRANTEVAERIRQSGTEILKRDREIGDDLAFVVVDNPELRQLFDAAGQEIHYAGACQRVGRCMRLAVTYNGEWAGGIVLGSTFPNIRPRDRAFGLVKFVKNWQERGLVSPWASENRDYWDRLQLIVNHARTFIFPVFQGQGLGVRAHALLLTEGRKIWEQKYGHKVHGFDTLCTHPNSRLFVENGWKLVGRTKGYTRDPAKVFSRRVFEEDWKNIKDNSGLGLLEGNNRWWIFVKVFEKLK